MKRKYKVIAWIGKDDRTSRMSVKADTPEDAVNRVRRQFSQTTVTIKEIRAV